MRTLKLTLAALLVFGAQSAQAVPLSFDWTNGSDTISWILDSNPVPNVVASNRFEIFGVSIVVNGAVTPTSAIRFFTPGSGGGFNISSGAFGLFPNVFGPVLFSGSLSTPEFLTGTFGFTDQSSLTIGAVPEPGTLALLVLGFAGIGLLRRRKKT